jgi:tRNA (guanine-N7-)-methyltransferase
MVGFEIRRKWATIVDNKLKERGFGARARVFYEDARFAFPLEGRLAVARVHPLSGSLVEEAPRKAPGRRTDPATGSRARLVPGGELFVQTDVEDRALQYEEAIAATPGLVPAPGGPRITENPLFGPQPARAPRHQGWNSHLSPALSSGGSRLA